MHSVNEQIAIVQMYIHHRKGIEVNISVRGLHDVMKLSHAYNIAIEWLNKNGFKIVK